MSKLSNYKSKVPEFQGLKEGSHAVRLLSYRESDSFHNYDGSLKEELPDYTNACEQLIIVIASTSGKGALTHRINLEGYDRFADLTKEEVASKKFTDVDGYACAIDQKSKKLVRLTNKERTAVAEGILDQFFSAIQLKEGSGIEDLDRAIADLYPFEVVVINEPYLGKDQFRINRFHKARVVNMIEKEEIEA